MVDKDGYKVTNPSLSSENIYRLPNGEEGSICIAPTMDVQLLYNFFGDFLAAAEVLEKDDPVIVNRVREYRGKLPPLKIRKHGQLQEWLEDYEEVEPGHRHISHLWGLYPGSQITIKDTKLIKACKTTLARREAHGGGHTGWSRAWMIALWARLCDGDEASKHVREISRTSTHDGLLDDHPPFQIDGNFGATPGITEMLVQSHAGEIHLLPALPSSWPEGSIHGVCARGGFEVSISWSSGYLIRGSIKSKLGWECVLWSNKDFYVTETGECLTKAAQFISFHTRIGGKYRIQVI
jgi:alpha-L-fucosidase 2